MSRRSLEKTKDKSVRNYKFRIYPTSEQEKLFLKTMGLKRLYWNLVLDAKQKDHKFKIPSMVKAFEQLKPEAVEWSKEIDSAAKSQCWSDLTQAFKNFFEGLKGNGAEQDAPKFKSRKTSKISFGYDCTQPPRFQNGNLYITKRLGEIKGTFHRFAEGALRKCNFERTTTGKWFVTITVEKKKIEKNHNGKVIGIDWNCDSDSFLTMSNGTKVKCPKFLRKKEKQLAHQQRSLERKAHKDSKGRLIGEQSNNYYKQKYKIAKIHEKIAWQRKDWLHKLSTELCEQYETVVVENINLVHMAEKAKNGGLNHGKAISDQGFGELRQMIATKGNLVKVNPKNTSKTCHCCSYVNLEVVLGIKKWKCPICEEIHDRDINAAKNILSKYVASLGLVGREPTEIKMPVEDRKVCSMKQESPNTSEKYSVILGSCRDL